MALKSGHVIVDVALKYSRKRALTPFQTLFRGDTASGAAKGNVGANTADGGWSGKPVSFPRIQGADCCGVIVAVGAGVPDSRIGEHILVRALQSTGASGGLFSTWTFGSECNGAFAQFTKTFALLSVSRV